MSATARQFEAHGASWLSDCRCASGKDTGCVRPDGGVRGWLRVPPARVQVTFDSPTAWEQGTSARKFGNGK